MGTYVHLSLQNYSYSENAKCLHADGDVMAMLTNVLT